MKKYTCLLMDLDDTILDFQKAEKYAICKLMEHYSIEASEENILRYHDINLQYWKKLELGLVAREDLILLRFIDFFALFGKIIDKEEARNVNALYFDNLSSVVFFIPNSREVLNELKKKYKIYLITNGVKRVQEKRLSLLGDFRDIFDKVFISEEIEFTKPDIRFSEYVLNDIKISKEECLIIGDSLSSDMMLGINSSIDTCWFNPKNKKCELNVNYIINDLNDLLKLL